MRQWMNIVENVTKPKSLTAVLKAHGLTQVKAVGEQWLVHFSDDAAEICKNGFTRGTPLEHPDWRSASGRDYETTGYNFAVAANDENGLAFWADNSPSAVVFRAAGVRSYHYDGFHQIIFEGSAVKRPMYLIRWADEDVGYVSVIDEADFAIVAKDGHPIPEPFVGDLYSVLGAIESGNV